MPKRLPSVVLVGRPNVGKSTLFNKITGTRRAIVTAIAGTTRDVIERLKPRRSDKAEEPEESAPAEPEEVSITIVGRPNAGKSSLVNRLLREERMIVSEMPGTTRDAVDTLMTWHRRKFRIVDTAGMRRPGRVGRGGQIESVSVLLTRRSIETTDIVVLLIDAT